MTSPSCAASKAAWIGLPSPGTTRIVSASAAAGRRSAAAAPTRIRMPTSVMVAPPGGAPPGALGWIEVDVELARLVAVLLVGVVGLAGGAPEVLGAGAGQPV